MTSCFRATAVMVAALGAGLLAAGCGSTSTSTGTPAAPASSSLSAAAAPSAAAVSSAAVSSAPPTSAAASTSAAAGATIKTESSSLGTVLTDSKGFTLYWFAQDTTTSSNCNGGCASAWPPLIGTPVAAAGVSLPGRLGTIKRSDGSLQATYDGHPLYTFASDSGPHMLSGNSVPGWHAVLANPSTPATSPSTAPRPAPSPAQSSSHGGYGY